MPLGTHDKTRIKRQQHQEREIAYDALDFLKPCLRFQISNFFICFVFNLIMYIIINLK